MKYKVGVEFVGVSGLKATITVVDKNGYEIACERRTKNGIEIRTRTVSFDDMKFFMKGYKKYE